jgi:hypothetical protein
MATSVALRSASQLEGEHSARSYHPRRDRARLVPREGCEVWCAIATETTTSATLVAGDRRHAVGSVATLVWSFTNFAAGEQLIFEVDLDRATGNPTVDAR